jgi:hypothetical protein
MAGLAYGRNQPSWLGLERCARGRALGGHHASTPAPAPLAAALWATRWTPSAGVSTMGNMNETGVHRCIESTWGAEEWQLDGVPRRPGNSDERWWPPGGPAARGGGVGGEASPNRWRGARIWTISGGIMEITQGNLRRGDKRETFSRVAPVAFKWGCGGQHRGKEMEGAVMEVPHGRRSGGSGLDRRAVPRPAVTRGLWFKRFKKFQTDSKSFKWFQTIQTLTDPRMIFPSSKNLK